MYCTSAVSNLTETTCKCISQATFPKKNLQYSPYIFCYKYIVTERKSLNIFIYQNIF